MPDGCRHECEHGKEQLWTHHEDIIPACPSLQNRKLSLPVKKKKGKMLKNISLKYPDPTAHGQMAVVQPIGVPSSPCPGPREGPVIIVNASEYSCDALAVLVDQNPVHIPLSITKKDVQEIASKLGTLTVRAKSMNMTRDLDIILRDIWDQVVSSIVDFFQTTHLSQSRIWCPTAEFSLLPLLVAGPYRNGQQNLSDLYISSCTSTLTALRDGRFTIERIIRFLCELENPQFAYLSASHTTVGDEVNPDEVIHLTSTMLFDGFRSVIGTMWAVDDHQRTRSPRCFMTIWWTSLAVWIIPVQHSR
ncbi:hypothetical protein J3R83DRAFT_1207 [Lanmaoa asiatica]|nr:hypothetical protein J3R83DRAFT_1207 [Lanmaoa asiatica]